jgi:hypothetical protein
MYTQFGGQVEMELPEGLTEETMLSALAALSEAREQSRAAANVQLQRSQGQLTDGQVRALSAHQHALSEAALVKFGLSLVSWTAAVSVWAKNSAKFKEAYNEEETKSRS